MTDVIFAARQLMEKHREKQKGLHIFIDLEKAYHRVPRQKVWRCMREKGVPEKYVMIVQYMYEGARTRVKSSVGFNGHDPSGRRATPRIFSEPLPFRHDYGCVGLRDKGSIPVVRVIIHYADDVVLCVTKREIVETRRVEKGYGRQRAEDQ